MAEVRLEGVGKAYGKVRVLDGIDLHVRDGEFMVFVGPSGCGKSTLLRMIAGLEEITHGDLFIGGRRVNEVPPAQRGIAMVFQSYALYPHMNLFENIAFGLRLAKVPQAEVERAVHEAAKVLNIDHLLDRFPKDLSGGQRQRVAIGRAIVRKPEVFLFDEPLSNLDAALRGRMRLEFARLHRAFGATTVYVTHDQVEAMTLADRIAVLSAGRLEQVGTPIGLYEQPVNRFVAGFIGSPRMNFMPGTVASLEGEGRVAVELAAGGQLRCPVQAPAGVAVGQAVVVGLRPEHLALQAAGTPLPPAGAALPVAIEHVETLGSSTQAHVRLAGAPADGSVVAPLAGEDDEGARGVLACLLDGRVRPRAGEAMTLHVPADAPYVFDADGRSWTRTTPAARAAA